LAPRLFYLEERTDFEVALQRLSLAYQPLVMISLLCPILQASLEGLDPAIALAVRADRLSDSVGLVPGDAAAMVLPAWLARAVSLARGSADIPDLPTLGAWCGCGPSHLSRSFRRHLGCTPSTFLARLRLDRAERLLAQTNQPVGDIIERVGFASPNYFHKLFRARQGLSPLEYRRRFGTATHLAVDADQAL
jgi:AraC-like DNA-binding protein